MTSPPTDEEAAASVLQALDEAVKAASADAVNADCIIHRDYLASHPGKNSVFPEAWDCCDREDALALWHEKWTLIELTSVRIRNSYRRKPASLCWVFDKIAMQSFCDSVCNRAITVPCIAAWRQQDSDDDSGMCQVKAAVEANTPSPFC
eukprot:TRINITY_DN44845_c0_g1_i2.p1 TRINITY_DN44845_c0_g1~~TRINITY_DN44845_c0_g1_i2.p1  ORF type:complete len:149 (+),score=33.90 TRINITY_DN44845_c0_g1_i2:205-651(+)